MAIQVTQGCVCVCFRRKVKDSDGSRCSWCWRRRTCCCLTVCHAWENTGSARHTPTLCSPHGTHSHTALRLSFCLFIQTHLWKTNHGTRTCTPFCLTHASVHTHANTHTFCMPVGNADQVGTEIHNCSLSQPVGKKRYKSITAIKGLLKLYEAAAITTRDRV